MHHHLIRKYASRNPLTPPDGYLISYSGAIFRKEFLPVGGRGDLGSQAQNEGIPSTEDYLGWADLLDAVERNERPSFTVAELGAGCGTWMLNAACLMREHHPEKSIHLIGVEAEPTHFDFMLRAFRDNDIDPAEHRLMKAALGNGDGYSWFYAGEPSEWYGQSIVSPSHVQSMLRKNGLPPTYLPHREGEMLETTNVYPDRPDRYRIAVCVPTIGLNDLIGDVDRVDFLHADIQGSELEMVENNIELIDAKVRSIHIGTHSDGIEMGLRDVFEAMGWKKRWDFPRKRTSSTPFGPLAFGDGVQSYLNPRLA